MKHALLPSPHILVFQEPWGLFLCHIHSQALMSVPTARLLSFTSTILKLPNGSPRHCPPTPTEHLTGPFYPRTLQWLPIIFRIRLKPLKVLTSKASPSTLHDTGTLSSILATLGNPQFYFHIFTSPSYVPLSP